MAIHLVFEGAAYQVPKASVTELLSHRSLGDAEAYAVRSSVPTTVFEPFVESLKSQTKISVTSETAAPLSLLAKEFFLISLAAECASFPVPVGDFALVAERVSQLERQFAGLESRIASLSHRSAPSTNLNEAHEELLESLRVDVEKLKSSIDEPFPDDWPQAGHHSGGTAALQRGNSGSLPRHPHLRPMVRQASHPIINYPPRALTKVEIPMKNKALRKVEIPMKTDKSRDGIISYFTKKHGGNVHEKGFVIITSKSAASGTPHVVADLNSTAFFRSNDERDQWICWDFREMRIKPSHYTITAGYLKSWIVEGSTDGASWTAMDEQKDTLDFKSGWDTGSFAVSKPAECRFVRLTQTDQTHQRKDTLSLESLELFGTVSEWEIVSKPGKTLNRLEFAMKRPNSLHGMISFLSKRNRGNVHDKGIVTITSKSVWKEDPKYAAGHVADLQSDSFFDSKDEPGQWVCWDFGKMRVCPSSYTISSSRLKSWVVEGSLDGRDWMEIDRQRDNQDFRKSSWTAVSFTVSAIMDCRFIRLTQTDKNHQDKDVLLLIALEFFGTLSEWETLSEPEKSLRRVDLGMTQDPLDGIIAYLTSTQGGNIHEKGIVTITAKSVESGSPKDLADLTSDSFFLSADERDQWVCWDFGERLVRPTHYTIRALDLKSWVVEGSMTGDKWKLIDQQTDNHAFELDVNRATFAVSKPGEYRFIRLTQTDKNYHDVRVRQSVPDFRPYYYLQLFAVEFFGSLSDWEEKALHGIIAYLTKKCRGNVHDKGLVTLTSESVYDDDPSHALRNLAELTSGSCFDSQHEPGQWVCWDFGPMRVQPTQYTIKGWLIKSWIIEGSLDGSNWTELHRETGNQDFKDWNVVWWFDIPTLMECRFIRLSQTDKNHFPGHCLRLHAVEFFGALFE
jgi:hypothetical protein